jgi:hypothetical protein
MSNLTVDPKLRPTVSELQRGSQLYKQWHWGEPAQRVIDGDDPDMPRMLIGIDQLVRLDFRAPNSRRHPRRGDTSIQFAKSNSRNSFATYDPNHPNHRIYLLINDRARKVLAERFWRQNSAPEIPLGYLAKTTGGRHATPGDYPRVKVKPIGVLTNIVYFTHKRGDGPSHYIHKLGEITHIYPILAADKKGRLWLAGGNYRAPTPGITD